MDPKHFPRSSINSFQHGLVDTELKSLKLLSRRLQNTLTVLESELQLLRRLYYKNKNQHRGALFWRSVVELRRYLRKVEDGNLLDSTLTLRNTFYGPTQNARPMKGTWTHFPDQNYLANCSRQYQISAKLLEKLSEVSLRAYISFYRSLQSAAFLQILLLFVAVSSRIRSLAQELQKVAEELHSSIENLKSALFLQGKHHEIEERPGMNQPAGSIVEDIDIDNAPVDVPASVEGAPPSMYKGSAVIDEQKPRGSNLKTLLQHAEKAVIEQKRTAEIPKKVKKSDRSIPGSDLAPKKKKRKVRNEIDDIFGF